jgi:hypothetical protein
MLKIAIIAVAAKRQAGTVDHAVDETIDITPKLCRLLQTYARKYRRRNSETNSALRTNRGKSGFV